MGATDGSVTPIVEPKPSGDRPETGLRALQERVRQQERFSDRAPPGCIGPEPTKGGPQSLFFSMLTRTNVEHKVCNRRLT